MRPRDLQIVIKLAIDNRCNLILSGAPGIGKTEIVKQAIKDLGHDSLISHPVTHDPTEYKGLGFPSEDRKSAEFLPYGSLKRMIEAIAPLVVVFDDAGQASTAVQAAMMQVIQERNIDGKKISDHVRFILCTNRKTDKAGVSMMIEPLKGRATIIELDVNDDDWRTWAACNGMPPELLAFSKLRPQMLFDFKPTADMTNSCTPRNWERVGRWQNGGLPKHLEYEVFKGCNGEQFAAEYSAFLKTFRDMPDPTEWITNPGKDLPTEESVKYALAAALSYMANPKNAAAIFSVAMRMDAEFSTFIVYSMINRDKKLSSTPGFITWAQKYGDYLV